MQFFVRLLIWGFAVVFAASPVVLTIAYSSSHTLDLVNLAAYQDLSWDLLFFAVAVIAIGVADALETLVSSLGPKPAQRWVMVLSLAMLIFMLPQFMIFANWSAVGLHMTSLDVQAISWLVVGAVVSAFGARLALLIGSA